MAISGNKKAADMGDGGAGTYDVRKAALRSIVAKAKKQKRRDFMPAGMRKQADKVGGVITSAQSVDRNIGTLLKTIMKKRAK